MADSALEKIEVTPQERDLIYALRRHEFSRVLRDISALMEGSEGTTAHEITYPTTPEEWKITEREADKDIAAGRLETFDTMEDFLADLKSDAEE